jgi:hypothetical protein
VFSAAALALVPASGPRAQEELPFMEYARVDPAKIVTAEACGECHASAYEVWKKTPHATTFKTMHRKERAETIAGALGFDLIKRDSFCFSCHYTPVVSGGSIRVISGVSCESCHGAGADWIEVHNDYGPDQTHETESDDHRRQRIDRSRQAGMRRPSDLYDVAANCFSCHSVPNERLVNVGGHSTGTSGFEFVERSQGEIRHNFLDSFKRGQIGPNTERTRERKRAMYVAGRALDLEHSLRGAALATSPGIYAKAMARRVRSATAEVKAIESAASMPETSRILAAVKAVRVGPGNEAALLAAAEEVARETKRFLARADEEVGGRLAALDPLLEGVSQIADTASDQGDAPATDGATQVAAATPSDSPASATASDLGDRGAGDAGPGSAAPGTVTSEGAAGTGATAPGVVGQIRTRIRPASSRRTLGSNACSGCHEPQNNWWFGHAHYRSVDPFFAAESKNVQIARLYGIDPAEMTTGRHVCMDCHGTIESGKETRDVLDGVSCESCHGAAGDWLEPHKDERDKELGRQRPGHLAALQLGKAPLGDLETRAKTCAGCHYVTEPRLLSAGHPSGADFDYVAGMAEVRHWQQAIPDTRLADAFATRLAARGAVPDVQVAALDPAAASESEPAEVAAGGPTQASTPTALAAARGRRAVDRRRAAGLEPPPPRPAFDVRLADATQGPLDLPPFPELDESTPIEDVLLRLQERLDLLYRAVSPTPEDLP